MLTKTGVQIDKMLKKMAGYEPLLRSSHPTREKPREGCEVPMHNCQENEV